MKTEQAYGAVREKRLQGGRRCGGRTQTADVSVRMHWAKKEGGKLRR